MNKFFNKFYDLPVLIIILSLIGLLLWSLINIKYDYIVNSSVLSQGSYLYLNKNNELKFNLNLNLYSGIKKGSLFQKNITEIELQKALLRKEYELLNKYKLDNNNKQNLFDISVWYITTSGIRNDINQLEKPRASRLLAGYYYLKKLNSIDKNNLTNQKFSAKLFEHIIINSKDPEFLNFLTYEPTRNLFLPLNNNYQQQKIFLERVLSDNNDIKSLESLCKYYNNNINNHTESIKLGYELAKNGCYSILSKQNKL